MIKIIALKEFSGTSFGNASPGDIVVVTPGQARHIIQLGLAEFSEDLTKKPFPDMALIPLSEVGQALPLSSATTQPAKAQPFAQTQALSDSQAGQTSSMAVTPTGGDDTTATPKRRARKSGRKTQEQPAI